MGQSIRKFTELPLQNQPALGQRVIVDIPTTADLESLLIMLSGTVTLTGAASNLLSDGVANIITGVDLIGDGKDVICSLPYAQIVNGNMFRRKTLAAPIVTQPGLTVAAQPFVCEGTLDLAAFNAIRPKDSSVRENSYKTLQLALRFAGDWTGVFNGGTISTTAFTLTIFARETIELKDDKGDVSTPIMRPLFSARDDNFSGAVTRQRFRLTPEQALRGISLRAINSTTVNDDAVLSRVRVYVGKDLRLDMSASCIKEYNKNGMAQAPGTGWYFLDFADGEGSPDKMNDCLDLRSVVTQGADAYIEYDTLKQGVVNIAQYGYVQL